MAGVCGVGDVGVADADSGVDAGVGAGGDGAGGDGGDAGAAVHH